MLEHEKALIGVVLRDDSWLPVVKAIVPPEAFMAQSLRQFYQVFDAMASAGQRIDALTVQAHMGVSDFARCGGSDVLLDCMGCVPFGDHVEDYANQVRKNWQQREFEQVLKQAIAVNQTEGLDASRRMVEEKLADFTSQSTQKPYRHISESLAQWYDEFERGLSDPDLIKKRFLPTGILDYDKKFLGLRKGLNILGARPAMGKSAYALTEALHIAQHGGKVVFVSIEMPDLEIDTRLISSLSNVDSLRLEQFQVNDASGEVSDVCNAFSILTDLPIWLSSVRKLDEVKSAVNQWRRENKCNPDAVFIDYLQLIEDGPNSEYAELSKISRELMYFFKFTVGCPCRLLCQLSRGVESRTDKRPMLSDIRGSGGIEQDADVVDFLYRDEYYNKDSAEKGVTEVIRAKSRQAPIGTVKVLFDPRTVTFKAYAGKEYGYQ